MCSSLVRSAAYSPTIAQRSQGQLLALLEGCLALNFCPPFGEQEAAPATDRAAILRPAHAADQRKLLKFKRVAAVQKQQWAKHLMKRKQHQKGQGLKRTVFTKRKERKPRRVPKSSCCPEYTSPWMAISKQYTSSSRIGCMLHVFKTFCLSNQEISAQHVTCFQIKKYQPNMSHANARRFSAARKEKTTKPHVFH